MSFGIIDYALGIVVLGALIGIYVCNKQQAVNPKAQMMSLGLLALVVIAGGALMWNCGLFAAVGIGKSADEQRAEVADQYYAAQGYMIGEKIGAENPGAKVLVIVTDIDMERLNNNDTKFRIGSLVEALKNSSVGANVEVDAPEISANLPMEIRAAAPFGQVVTGKDINNVIGKHNPDAVIFACEVPQSENEFNAISLLKKKNNKVPVYFVLNTISITKAQELLKGKNIAGAIQRKRGFRASGKPANMEQAFNEAYVFVEPAK